MNIEDLISLAKLAKLNLSDEKLETFSSEFDAILSHISELQNASDADATELIPEYHHQYLRQDIAMKENPRYSQDYKSQIVSQMPQSREGYLVVKSVLKK